MCNPQSIGLDLLHSLIDRRRGGEADLKVGAGSIRKILARSGDDRPHKTNGRAVEVHVDGGECADLGDLRRHGHADDDRRGRASGYGSPCDDHVREHA